MGWVGLMVTWVGLRMKGAWEGLAWVDGDLCWVEDEGWLGMDWVGLMVTWVGLRMMGHL